MFLSFIRLILLAVFFLADPEFVFGLILSKISSPDTFLDLLPPINDI